MRPRTISRSGTITQDGHLQMYMAELNEFFAKHKGKRVMATFKVAEKGTSQALRGYYFNCVVPTFQTAIWQAGERKTQEQTELFMRQLSPIMHEESVNEETGKYTTRIRGISELSNAELIEHIDTLKQIAAEEYSVYIEEPRTI